MSLRTSFESLSFSFAFCSASKQKCSVFANRMRCWSEWWCYTAGNNKWGAHYVNYSDSGMNGVLTPIAKKSECSEVSARDHNGLTLYGDPCEKKRLFRHTLCCAVLCCACIACVAVLYFCLLFFIRCNEYNDNVLKIISPIITTQYVYIKMCSIGMEIILVQNFYCMYLDRTKQNKHKMLECCQFVRLKQRYVRAFVFLKQLDAAFVRIHHSKWNEKTWKSKSFI